MLSLELVTQAIIGAVKSCLPFPHYRILLFGSRATGKATPRSDFDVGVDAEARIPLEVIVKIKEDMDAIPILQKIDLVDLASASEDFKHRAKEAAKVIYEQ